MFAGAASAATLTVDTTADPSTSDGLCSLREAIASINAAANSGDCVASGTYNGGSGVPDVIDFNIAGKGKEKVEQYDTKVNGRGSMTAKLKTTKRR